MTVINMLEMITEYAKQYRKESQASLIRNNHMNDLGEDEFIKQKHIDAVVVDFVNFIGNRNSIDYALYTKDLRQIKQTT